MAQTIKLEIRLPHHAADDQYRADKVIETLVDHVLPKMATSVGLTEDEIFARLLIELGHIIGITHAPDSALSMIGMMTEAILQGQQAALETTFNTAPQSVIAQDDTEALPEWADQCSPIRH